MHCLGQLHSMENPEFNHFTLFCKGWLRILLRCKSMAPSVLVTPKFYYNYQNSFVATVVSFISVLKIFSNNTGQQKRPADGSVAIQAEGLKL